MEESMEKRMLPKGCDLVFCTPHITQENDQKQITKQNKDQTATLVYKGALTTLFWMANASQSNSTVSIRLSTLIADIQNMVLNTFA